MNEKRQKLSIVALIITALACFIVAIFGTTTGSTAVDVSANGAVKTYTVITTVKDGGQGFRNALAPSEGATSVTFVIKPLVAGGGATSFNVKVQGESADDVFEFNAGLGGGSIFAPGPDGTATYHFDLANDTIPWGQSFASVVNQNYFSLAQFNDPTNPLYGEFEVKIYDDLGKDLGVVAVYGVAIPDGVEKTTFDYSATNGNNAEGLATLLAPDANATEVTLVYNVKKIQGAPFSFYIAATKPDGTSTRVAIGGEAGLNNFAGDIEIFYNPGWYGEQEYTHVIKFNLETGFIDTRYVDATIADLKDYTNFGIYFGAPNALQLELNVWAFDNTGKDLGVIGVAGAGWVTDEKLTAPTDETYLTDFMDNDYQIVAGMSNSGAPENYLPIIDGIATVEDGVLHISKPAQTSTNIGFRFGRTLTAEDVAKGGDLIIRLKYAATDYNLKYCAIDGWNKAHANAVYYNALGNDFNCSGNTHNYGEEKFVDYVIDNATLQTMLDADGELKGIQTNLTTTSEKADLYFDYVRYVVGYNVVFNPNNGNDSTTVFVGKGLTVDVPTSPVKEGFVFLGWYSDEELTTAYYFDTPVNQNIALYAKYQEESAFLQERITMGGTSIRINEVDSTGIRFAVNVDTQAINLLKDKKDNGEIKGYTFGTLIVPVDLLEENALTVEGLANISHYNIVSSGFYRDTTVYYASIMKVMGANYDRKWAARGYIELTHLDDSVTYVYADYDLNNAKSIYDVALTAYNDTQTAWDEDEISALKSYINGVVILDENYALVDKGVDYEESAVYTITNDDGVITITAIDEITAIKSVVINGEWVNATIATDGKSATYIIG